MEGIVNISSENHRNQSPKELYITSNKTKQKKKKTKKKTEKIKHIKSAKFKSTWIENIKR